MRRKFKLEGILTLRKDFTEKQKKELAARLDLPENEENQRDLMFMSAILVSTGTNKNGAHFLGSELVKARNTISQKPLNIEHQEQAIAGHITEWLYMSQAGDILDDKELYSKIVCKDKDCDKALDADPEKMQKNAEEIDQMSMDIGIICVVYRDRFPELAEDIELGKYKVSMECYYESFDIKVGEIIIPRKLAQTASIEAIAEAKVDGTLLPIIRDVANGKSLGNIQVARVLRDIHFCGVGLVENPANIRSLILEAAKELEERSKGLSVTEGQCAVASVDLDDLSVEEESIRPIELLVSEESKTQTYLVIVNSSSEGGAEVESLQFDSLEEAKESAAQLVFKLHNAYSRESNYSVTVVEVCSEFSVQVPDQTNQLTTYRVIDGIVEESLETMSSSKLCSIVDMRGKCILPEIDQDSVDEKVESEENSEQAEETTKEEQEKEDQEDQEADTTPDEEVEVKDQEEAKEESEEADVEVTPVPSKKVEKFDIPSAPKRLDRLERSKLSNDSFALRESRKFPIHTEDRVKANMDMFSYTRGKLSSSEEQEFFKNIIIAALKCGLDTQKFESSVENLKFKEGRDYSSSFGVPRLKKFPLDTREQVISAMSRFPRLKMDLSALEREGLFINILRAAARLGISTDSFRKRVLDPSD